uniref:cytochrome c oxidase subunit III n=1 Tax=Craseoschema thyasiricola TaxID=2665145 RepID=UPI001EDEB198|nr:cytochrome c oxidase subunit III [Craseoschema thyasiricola]UJV31468.1 cytochrome c oxidase subunit 3 [Craseoschema thyasiricola]
MIRQPYHLVQLSPWPLTSALAAMAMFTALGDWFYTKNLTPLLLAISLILLNMYMWWRDIVRESTYMGKHTTTVVTGLKAGMILFISSEAVFFAGFFWAFFHSSLAPAVEIGCSWPPLAVSPIDPFSVPLLNTAILLSSGITVTWAHHALLENNKQDINIAMYMTIFLGMYFTFLQAQEYMSATFSIADSVFGSTFYVATGFHGLHVLVGTSALLISFLRIKQMHFTQAHHFGFEASIWYWHFVDVIWIFLYICIYWWGSM